VSHGAALPHMRSGLLDRSHVLVARVLEGVRFEDEEDEGRRRPVEPVRAVFFLVSPEADPGLHLRILAQIAGRVDQDSFMPEWMGAHSDEELKEALFRDERMLVLRLGAERPSAEMIGLRLRELSLPDGTLIAMIRRAGELVIPRGDTPLEDGDRLTVIGRPEGINALRHRYAPLTP
jgi:APA family basic amino acid/polyamine antiporter